MSKPVPTTWLAIAMVPICYLMAGGLIKSGGMIFVQFHEFNGAELLKITQIFLSLSQWPGTVPLLLLLGLLASWGLAFVARQEALQAHLPIAFTMAWLLVLMIVVSAFFAVLLPLIFLVEEAS
ncbi:MAG: hypothetical protein VCA37_06245 [Roseibacillus sp.]